MKYQIKFNEKARKQFAKIETQLQQKILKYLLKESLLNKPTTFGKPLSKRLKGLWRYRVGNYRIICDIRKTELVILVVEIGHRSKIYDN